MYKIPLYFLKEILSVVKLMEKSLSGELPESKKKLLLGRISKIKATLQRIVGDGTK
jgi:hypothetical protein